MVLRGQAALVTGAGRGIGRASALALAGAGARVAVNDLDPRSAAETVEEIRQAGGQALALPGDVSVQETVEPLVAGTVREFGRLDVAVANAYYSAREAFWQADMASFRRTIDVTMWGAFYTLRAAARLDPASPSAHYGLGVALAGLGRHAEAVGPFRFALLLRPDLAEACSNLGNSLQALGQYDEALTQCDAAIRLLRQPLSADRRRFLSFRLMVSRSTTPRWMSSWWTR